MCFAAMTGGFMRVTHGIDWVLYANRVLNHHH